MLDHWTTIKPAYSLKLEDGTELLTSGDHRFLSDRGWKHVLYARAERPHLTVEQRARGNGRFAYPPRETVDYKRGYLCGMIRGDGHRGCYVYTPPSVGETSRPLPARVHRSRGALRARITCRPRASRRREFLFAEATGRTVRSARWGRNRGREVDAIREISDWPGGAPRDGTRGSSPGSSTPRARSAVGISRIWNTDETIIDWTLACSELGVDVVVEDRQAREGNVRVRGGLEERLRFYHLTDPAITRKRSIEGRAMKSQSRVRGSSRSSRSGWSSRSTTSRPARATSSPTAW